MTTNMKNLTIKRMLLNKLMQFAALLALLSEGFVLFFYHGPYQKIWLTISLGVMFVSLLIFKATENNNKTHIGILELDEECVYIKPKDNPYTPENNKESDMKTRYLTLLITFTLGIGIGIVFVEIYRHYNLKQEQQKALVDSALNAVEDAITILQKFQEKNKEISQQKNDSSLQTMILPQVKFVFCFKNNGYSSKVKISDEEEAFLIGNDTCGEGVNGELLKGLLLDKDTKSKDVVFIRKDQPKIAETINITYDDGAFTLTRPNGHVITSVNPKN